ncbi:MAG: Ferric uptake regulation protein, partial [Planctomycetota bacterium]
IGPAAAVRTIGPMSSEPAPGSTMPAAGEHASPIPAFAPLCAVFRRFLKSRDLKYTQERADILDAIIARDGAFEAEELLLELRGRGHDVSKATVYRTIRLLIDAGIITQSLFDAKQSHYELLYGREPRDFMVCMKTGRRIEFRNAELVELRDRICRELGWQPVGHRFQIFAIAPGDDRG